MMADTHCFVCHADSASDADAADTGGGTTAHTQRSIYALLEQFLGYSVLAERSATDRWCASCMALVNDYDLAVQTAARREGELVELYVTKRSGAGGGGAGSDPDLHMMRVERLESEEDGDGCEPDEKTTTTMAPCSDDDEESQATKRELRDAQSPSEMSVKVSDDDADDDVRVVVIEGPVPANDDDDEEDTKTSPFKRPDRPAASKTEEQDAGDEHNSDQVSVMSEAYLSDGGGMDEDDRVEEQLEEEEEVHEEFEIEYGAPDETLPGRTVVYSIAGLRDDDTTAAAAAALQPASSSVFRCMRCDTHFDTNAGYKTHITACKSQCSTYECDVCGVSTRTRTAFKIHVAKHYGIAPYECDVCGKQFSHRGALVRHMPLHTGERPYQVRFV